ncbi:hypothetical protein [Butyrivibrio sp. AC2005]|uniref:hypothetical protein n=1 Tax=Butyrivibrio sp. AC2005 TaxID=1280672 RepID=UPI0004012174|nr:hypothetical protein [Butyrivibrio sp. AC2005]
MIKRFKEVSGLYIEKIYGQDRLAFAMSDTSLVLGKKVRVANMLPTLVIAVIAAYIPAM